MSLGQLQEFVRSAAVRGRLNPSGSLRLYTPSLVQLAADADTTVNFWGPGVTGIHNHYTDFESDIVLGMLRNVLYQVRPAWLGAYREYLIDRQTQRISGGWRVNVTPVLTQNYGAGGHYAMTGAEVHSTVVEQPTITIMRVLRETEGTQERFYVPRRQPATETVMRPADSGDKVAEAWTRIDTYLDLL